MTMRRVALAGCLIAALAACSSDDDDTTATDASDPASTVSASPALTQSTSPTSTASGPDSTTGVATTGSATSAPPSSITPTTAADGASGPLQIDTTLGAVRGTNSKVAGVRAFLGIPYAAPPTGDNRWRPPQPHASWTSPRAATRPTASCPQPTEGIVAQFLITPRSKEDCLTLSVWSPAEADGLPVMVFFHGGGLSTGSAHQPYYIGDNLASHGAVIVNVNYRLGALGFLAAEMLAEEEGDAVGNYGLADQVAALEWVRDNAIAFAGDPDNVTIFGESAGGFSVCGHLASPMSEGLFHKAIIQSGGGCNRQQSAADAARAGADFAAEVGCDDLACLRRLPARRLVAAPFNPVLVADGERLTTSAYEQAVDGSPTDIPVLTGSNADEATLFMIGAPEPSDAELQTQFGDVSDDPAAVAALYPDTEFDSNLAKSQALFTEGTFTCPALAFADVIPNGFAYYYSYVSPGNPFGLGATHGAELAFVFGHPEGIRNLEASLDPASRRLAQRIRRAWVDFATDGVPEDWPTYAESGQIIQFDRPVELVDEIRDGRCEALAELSR